MTQEEKAKAYDEALERARKIHSEIVNNEIIGFPGQITDIFPELAESEDERIRKEIVGVIQKHYQNTPESYRWISWLEKQKEPARKFTVQELLNEYDKGYEHGKLEGITAGYNKAMKEMEQKEPENTSASTMAPSCWEVEQKEQKPVEWSGPKFKPGMENVLKSLRPGWKPSEEHLSALLAIFNDPDNIGSATCQLALSDLYEQLKKL